MGPQSEYAQQSLVREKHLRGMKEKHVYRLF